VNTRLCRVDDIADGGSAGFAASIDGRDRPLLAVRKGERVFVYINRCPHRGLPLDLMPGEFVTHDGEYILCRNHAALFRIEDGRCAGGPCGGMGLVPVAVTVNDGDVLLV
jgi:nitrite reductase/ring-hydroxylating ferredoxin subunit